MSDSLATQTVLGQAHADFLELFMVRMSAELSLIFVLQTGTDVTEEKDLKICDS